MLGFDDYFRAAVILLLEKLFFVFPFMALFVAAPNYDCQPGRNYV